MGRGMVCQMCQRKEFVTVAIYHKPPKGETVFPFSVPYHRRLMMCETCGHFVNRCSMDLSQLYSYDYVQAAYGGEKGIAEAFNKIMTLPPEESDNLGRTRAIYRFWQDHRGLANWGKGKLLDVGTGLAVFPTRMIELGWQDITVLDADSRLISHAVRQLKIRGVVKDWMEAGDESDEFDLITMNQVIEHSDNPIEFLARVKLHMKPGAFVYCEVPDGRMAISLGPEREEFLLDHRCAFSMASFCLLVDKAGLRVVKAERIRQPSGKFTIRGFAAWLEGSTGMMADEEIVHN